MIDDLSKMGDQEFMAKWDTSRQYPIRARKKLGIRSFNNQHGTKEHKIEGDIEYKWCQQGHWERIENFGKHTSRYDGLRGWCKSCSHKKDAEGYDRNGAERQRNWLKTEKGRKSKSATMRRVWLKRRGNYVKFDLEDEERIYSLCDYSCAYCRTPILFDELEFDHFIPIVLGGKTEPSNMLPSCQKCNRGRGGKFEHEPKIWLVTKFGPVIGLEIYDKCVNLLSVVAS